MCNGYVPVVVGELGMRLNRSMNDQGHPMLNIFSSTFELG